MRPPDTAALSKLTCTVPGSGRPAGRLLSWMLCPVTSWHRVVDASRPAREHVSQCCRRRTLHIEAAAPERWRKPRYRDSNVRPVDLVRCDDVNHFIQEYIATAIN